MRKTKTSKAVKKGVKPRSLGLPPLPEFNRKEAFARAINLLREYFDAGIVEVSWTEGVKTFELYEDFGSSFAISGMMEAINNRELEEDEDWHENEFA